MEFENLGHFITAYFLCFTSFAMTSKPVLCRSSSGNLENDSTLVEDGTSSSNNSSQEIDVTDITKEGCEKAQPSHFDLLRVLGQVKTFFSRRVLGQVKNCFSLHVVSRSALSI